MDAHEAIATVLTIREYDTKRTVSKETIKKILDAGRLTASARNSQPWAFIAITSRDTLRKIAQVSQTGRHIASAAFAVAVVTDPTNRYHEIDSSRAVQSMTIAAWNEGLGSSWVGAIDRENVKELLKIPSHLNLLTVLPFGYPTKKYRGKKRRKPAKETMFLESYAMSFE